MKHLLFFAVVFAFASSAFAGDEYSADAPVPYQYLAAVQAAFDSFAQRHPVVQVYPSRTERVNSITFAIEGYTCSSNLKYNPDEGAEVTCSPAGQPNGYRYHEDQKGNLIPARRVTSSKSRRHNSRKKICIYWDLTDTWPYECGQ